MNAHISSSWSWYSGNLGPKQGYSSETIRHSSVRALVKCDASKGMCYDCCHQGGYVLDIYLRQSYKSTRHSLWLRFPHYYYYFAIYLDMCVCVCVCVCVCFCVLSVAAIKLELISRIILVFCYDSSENLERIQKPPLHPSPLMNLRNRVMIIVECMISNNFWHKLKYRYF